jgi:hypothetical protein
MTWTRSVARITVGGRRGTGALISGSGLVLTAFHVVADLDASLQQQEPQWFTEDIEAEFGDPKQGTPWKRGNGTAKRTEHFSISNDWVVLQLDAGSNEAEPLPIMKPDPQRTAFKTFGFPKYVPVDGTELSGTIGALGPRTVQLTVGQLPVGQDMRGISGAPCLVDGHIVGIVQQQLANENNKSIAAVLFMLPIDVAMAGHAIVPWEDGTKLMFQDLVEANLPADDKVLDVAGDRLGLAQGTRTRTFVARRLLVSGLYGASDALKDLLEPSKRTRRVLDCVGAMSIHGDAAQQLRDALAASKTPWVQIEKRLVHWWCLRRAFDSNPELEFKRVVVIRLRPGTEEQPLTSDAPTPEAAVVREIARELETKLTDLGVTPQRIRAMLSTQTNLSADVTASRRFWLILVGDLRLNLESSLRKRLPNAQVVLGTVDRATARPEVLSSVAPIFPVLAKQTERDVVDAWWASTETLELAPEPGDDD